MKKGLSVLLIAAALFGFYGGAVNINDVLACKDYWEEAGKKSTADMNKLEDGLNQLKENEQAYLDGKDQLAEGEKTLAEGEIALAEGEKALADGEAKLAAGEAKLADGEAQYAKGLADYAAAPAKLADGEAALAEGEDSYKQLNTLISGLREAKLHGTKSTEKHDVYWHDAFSKALKPGKALIISTLKDQQDTVAMLEMLTGAKNLVNKASGAKSYKSFDKVLTDQLIPTFKKAAKLLRGFAKIATDKADTLDSALEGYGNLKALEASEQVKGAVSGYQSATGGSGYYVETPGFVTAKGLQWFANSPYGADYKAKLSPILSQMEASPYFSQAPASTLLLGSVGQQMTEFLGSDNGKTLQGIAAKGDASKGADKDASLPDQVALLVQGMQALAGLTGQGANDGATFENVEPQVSAGLNSAAKKLNEYAGTADESVEGFKTWHKGYNKLNKGKNKQLASTSEGIPYAFKNMVSNPTIKAAIKKNDKSLLKELKNYSDRGLKDEGFDAFDADLVHICQDVIPRALTVLGKVKKDASSQLAAGRKELKAGKKSYEEAPGKLADARKQLADGRKQLANGRKQLADGYRDLEDGRAQLADGYQALEDGKAQLAQYEDGEQQVRDGLATLVGTEPDLDLVGILDRLDGDGDFDNGDDHLDIDEGLKAVDVGRGYQADDGVLITNEIMARAVGTGALLGAGVLAVLAAILSFLKKNKGAGVFAILAAAAGAFGAFYGTNAGTYFSDIAGSTAGSTAWVAAGVLGAVALVHAIVHFSAKKTAA